MHMLLVKINIDEPRELNDLGLFLLNVFFFTILLFDLLCFVFLFLVPCTNPLINLFKSGSAFEK